MRLLTRLCYHCVARLVTRLRSYHEKMVEAGYQPIVFEDYMDMLADQLNAINGGADALTLPVGRWITLGLARHHAQGEGQATRHQCCISLG